MLLFDPHVPEQGDVGMLGPAQKARRLFEWILPAFLPPAQHADAGRLKGGLHQSGKRANASAEDNQAHGAPEVVGAARSASRLGVEQLEQRPADEAADRPAQRAVAELAKRSSRKTLAH